MTSQIVDALHLLVDDFCAQGCHLHAIKCLEALCNVETLPHVGAGAHVRLSELLLEHTNNLREAKIHATRAQIAVKGLPRAFHLKCRIAFQLGACHHKLGDYNLRKQAYLTGLELCKDSALIQNEPTAHDWFCQFSVLLADALLDEDQSQKALQHLWRGQERAKKQKLNDHKIVLEIFHTQALLSSGDSSAAADNLKELLRCKNAHKSDLDTSFSAQASLQALILQLLISLKQGHIIPLVKNTAEIPGAPGTRPKKVPMVVKEMEDLLQKCDGTKPVFSTSPWAILKITAALLSATILRYQGKSDLVIEYVKSGLTTTSDELKKYGMEQDDKGCWGKGCSAQWRVGPFLLFRYLLLEILVQTKLLKCEFMDAQAALVDILQFLDACPSMGASVRLGAHLLAGLYLHSVGQYGTALKHFRLVVEANADPSQALFGRMCCALSELGASTSESVSLAIDAVGPDLYDICLKEMGTVEQTMHQFVSGYIHHCQSNTQEAKAKISSGLKLVHRQVGNHELMCNMLNVLSVIHLDRGDIPGAQQMLDSCYTLAKHCGDIVAVLGSFSTMEKLYKSNQMQDKLGAVQSLRKMEKKILLQNTQKAIDSDMHGLIEHWDLGM